MQTVAITLSFFIASMLLSFNNAAATAYKGIEFPAGIVSFADRVISYMPGTGGVGSGYDDPQHALGVPDYLLTPPGTIAYTSMGSGGSLVLKFTDNSLATSGSNAPDLWVFEIGGFEATEVFISGNGSNWIDVGATSSSMRGIDIDAFESSGVLPGSRYAYVKLIDLTVGSNGYSAGADIDAVGAISSAAPIPNPEPGTMALMAVGLGDMAWWRGKTRRK
ncbi:MAG: PEP-CTERM sorting domain-containing protein [Nitrospirae bacterium]|nr:PEP-CTERM sorting domain-containing protein [Nitrospirota bacterium]